MTVDDFLEWDDGTETRYELVDGQVRPMPPHDERHPVIHANVVIEVGRRLQERAGWRAQVRATVQLNERTIWLADMTACDGPLRVVAEPALVVEVHTLATRCIDLGTKLDDYKEIPSVQEIWMVDSTRRRVQVWRRTEHRWIGEDDIGKDAFRSQTAGGEPLTLDLISEHSGL